MPTLPTAVKLPRDIGSKQKAAALAARNMSRARNAVAKIEEQNDKSAAILQSLSALWLSPDANRRRVEAEIALNHFNEALTTLRKSLPAT